ncbi:MAG TPA: glucose-6-phosphate isomerase [Actinomycetota bacterium]|jgi:glucose-6-phosphate isomerase
MTLGDLTFHGIDVDPPVDLVGRIWARDPGAWGPGEDDPAERLGWLELPRRYPDRLSDVESFAEDVAAGVEHVVLLGMGGSSLAPEVFAATQSTDRTSLVVCDSTHPDEVAATRARLDLDRSLFVVSSKSGGTIETMSLYRYFRSLVPAGERFVAITDPATSLARLATEEDFVRTFVNPADIGGRYSALSYFGIVPAALAGVSLAPVLESARGMTERCTTDVGSEENPGLVLGSAIAELARGGRDKLTFVISDRISAFGDWVEQLLAESTGKNGVGIVPIVGEPALEPAAYGSDRAFVVMRLASDGAMTARARDLAGAGHPVVLVDVPEASDVGGQMFLWEFATAVAGAVMGINPFDQPDVEAAKRASRSVLESDDGAPWGQDDPGALFDELTAGDLAVVCAFAPRTSASEDVLDRARAKLLRVAPVATMAGFGPRYLHSTGQLHKGGPPGVRALVVLDEPEEQVAIPDAAYGFGELVAAQAAGDAKALTDAGRPVARASWAAFEAWASE